MSLILNEQQLSTCTANVRFGNPKKLSLSWGHSSRVVRKGPRIAERNLNTEDSETSAVENKFSNRLQEARVCFES